MAVANLKKIDDKLKNIYENQVTVNNNQPFEDKSEILFAQMNFIAMANKQALHLIQTTKNHLQDTETIARDDKKNFNSN